MLPADRHHEPAAASSTPPITWVIGVVFVVVFGFSAICAYVLFEMRRATWERAVEVAASLATAIENDVSRNFETLDLSLRGVVDNLKHPDIDRIAPDLRQLVLFDRSATAKHLGTILVLDEAGNVRIDSRTVNPPRLNLADRDYFRAQKDNPSLGMYIGSPQITTADRPPVHRHKSSVVAPGWIICRGRDGRPASLLFSAVVQKRRAWTRTAVLRC